jgi:hypothetical protein
LKETAFVDKVRLIGGAVLPPPPPPPQELVSSTRQPSRNPQVVVRLVVFMVIFPKSGFLLGSSAFELASERIW